MVGPEIKYNTVLFIGTFVQHMNQFQVIFFQLNTSFLPAFADEGTGSKFLAFNRSSYQGVVTTVGLDVLRGNG